MMNTIVKRLAPTAYTLRELFLRSGNLCAFPGCNRLMMDTNGNFVGQICHIEAALVGGERFNSAMSNEERRDAKNLMLMCYEHHVQTNDVSTYSVSTMKSIKEQHEMKFSTASIAMLQSIRDWTTESPIVTVNNLNNLNSNLKYRYPEADLQELVIELNQYLAAFARVPLELRHFLGQFAIRRQLLKENTNLPSNGVIDFVPIKELELSFRMSSNKMKEFFDLLSFHKLAYIEAVDGAYSPPYGAFINSTASDWNLWGDIAEFCIKANRDIQMFSNELRFDILDS